MHPTLGTPSHGATRLLELIFSSLLQTDPDFCFLGNWRQHVLGLTRVGLWATLSAAPPATLSCPPPPQPAAASAPPTPRDHVCTQCGFTANSLRALRTHDRVHGKQVWNQPHCPTCGAHFTTPHGARIHMQNSSCYTPQSVRRHQGGLQGMHAGLRAAAARTQPPAHTSALPSAPPPPPPPGLAPPSQPRGPKLHAGEAGPPQPSPPELRQQILDCEAGLPRPREGTPPRAHDVLRRGHAGLEAQTRGGPTTAHPSHHTSNERAGGPLQPGAAGTEARDAGHTARRTTPRVPRVVDGHLAHRQGEQARTGTPRSHGGVASCAAPPRALTRWARRGRRSRGHCRSTSPQWRQRTRTGSSPCSRST